MTEKRFTLTYEKLGKYFSMGIIDHETKEPFDDTTYEFHQCSFNDSKDEMGDLCLLLNALHEENELLKNILKDITIQLDANHTLNTYQMTIPVNRVIYNELKRRLKETSFNE